MVHKFPKEKRERSVVGGEKQGRKREEAEEEEEKEKRMLPTDISVELAKRAIANIFISHGLATNIDNTDILSILAELLSLGK